MCVDMCVHDYLCVCVHVYSVFACVFVYPSVYVTMCVHVCVFTCMCARVYVCARVCVHMLNVSAVL